MFPTTPVLHAAQRLLAPTLRAAMLFAVLLSLLAPAAPTRASGLPLLEAGRFFAAATSWDPTQAQQYLEGQPGRLAAYSEPVADSRPSAAEIIVGAVRERGIDPRLMLAIIEAQSGAVRDPDADPADAFGIPAISGLAAEASAAARLLSEGMSAFLPGEQLRLRFADGSILDAPAGLNATTYALLRVLASTSSANGWSAEAALTTFHSAYQALFGEAATMSATATMSAQLDNSVAPFLSSPYPGAYDEKINSWFDHEHPNYTENGSLTHYSGERRSSGGIGISWYDGHSGIDYQTATGTPVLSAAEGQVVKAFEGWVDCSFIGMGRRYDRYVAISHPNGYTTLYNHLDAIEVAAGQAVARGQQIGLSGNSGCSTGPHLHFQVNANNRPTDPFGWQGGYAEPCAISGTCTTSAWLWIDGDSTAPTATLAIAPAPNAEGWNNGPVQITPGATDASDLRAMTIRISRDGDLLLERSAATLTPITLDADGRYQVELTASDRAGNSGTATLEVKIDQRVPALHLGEPDNRRLRAEVDDGDGSGGALLQCSSDGGSSWADCATALPLAPEIQVRACDWAGNCAEARLQTSEPGGRDWFNHLVRGQAFASLIGQSERVESGVYSRPGDVQVTPGARYTLRAQVRAERGAASLTVIWYDRNFTVLGRQRLDFSGASDTLGAQVTAPGGASFARVDLMATSAGLVWFDDVGLIDASGANLLPNADFSAGLDGWVRYTPGGRQHLVISEVAPAGAEENPALRIDAQTAWTSDDGLQIIGASRQTHALHLLRADRSFAVRPGERYTLNLPLRSVNLQGSAEARVVFRDAAGRQVGAAVSAAQVAGTFGWRWVAADLLAPDRAVSAQVVLDMRGTGALWADTVVLIGR